jgi:hypothetical protein
MLLKTQFQSQLQLLIFLFVIVAACQGFVVSFSLSSSIQKTYLPTPRLPTPLALSTSSTSGTTLNMTFSMVPQTQTPAPMYITVGPQCCGKTTILKQQNVLDISLDDQPHVYHHIPTNLLMGTTIIYGKSQIIYGKSLYERIKENVEMRLLLNRWNGTLSPQNFCIGVLQLYPSENERQLAKEYVTTVEEFLSQNPSLPQTCAIFVVQALFQKTAKNNQTSAIDRAHHLLHQAPLHQPVAWGNTNTQPRDYQTALEIASQQGRPVHFLVYGQPPHEEPNRPPVVPAVPFSQLLRRNLERFQQTGKYVPLGSMYVACQRVEQLILKAKACNPVLEQGLVQQASTQEFNFVLYANRTIGKERNNNNNNNNNNNGNAKQNPGWSQQSRKRGPRSSTSRSSSSSFRQPPPPAQRRRRDDSHDNGRPSRSSNNNNYFGEFRQYQGRNPPPHASSSSSWR